MKVASVLLLALALLATACVSDSCACSYGGGDPKPIHRHVEKHLRVR
jgi:hypothetical protein